MTKAAIVTATATVEDGFKLFAKNTDLTLTEYLSVTQAQAEIERFLSRHFTTFSTVLHGSFSRKTMMSPLQGATVNMIVLFQDDQIKHRLPSLVFRELSECFIEQYPETKSVKNSNTILLPVENFTFNIQPGYSTDNHVYMLPAPMFNDWIKHDSHHYNDYFVKENVRHKGELTAIVRMIKTWNKISGKYFDGYYLELLVTDLMSRCDSRSLSESICYVFKTALKEVVFQKQDPANKEFNVDGLHDIEDLIKAMLLLKESCRIAEEAVALEQSDDMEKAIGHWNLLFPGVFPTHTDMVVSKIRNQGIKGADALRMMLDHK